MQYKRLDHVRRILGEAAGKAYRYGSDKVREHSRSLGGLAAGAAGVAGASKLLGGSGLYERAIDAIRPANSMLRRMMHISDGLDGEE